MTLFTSLSVYAIILHDLKDVAWIQSEWSRIQSVVGCRTTLTQLLQKRKTYATKIPTFHPLIQCYNDPTYLFPNVTCSYPIKISRTITICM